MSVDAFSYVMKNKYWNIELGFIHKLSIVMFFETCILDTFYTNLFDTIWTVFLWWFMWTWWGYPFGLCGEFIGTAWLCVCFCRYSYKSRGCSLRCSTCWYTTHRKVYRNGKKRTIKIGFSFWSLNWPSYFHIFCFIYNIIEFMMITWIYNWQRNHLHNGLEGKA